jgi:putative SOS response-associated peptidase YedK
MCGRYSLAVSAEELEQIFSAVAEGPLDLPRWNVAPTQDAPVVVMSREGRRLTQLRWGLVPFWADDPSIGARHINARAETLATRPAFKEALERRRCLVPADGFYEWADRPGGGPRVPHWIHHKRGGVLAFAGLRERWRPRGSEGAEGEPLRTFTIITTAPNRTIAPLHDRMPVVLPPTVWDAWLDPATPSSDALALLVPAPEELLEARAVSTRVNRVEHDDAGCTLPVVDRGPELLDLFEGG